MFRDGVREVLFDREMPPWRDCGVRPMVVTEAPGSGSNFCEGCWVGRALGVCATAFSCLDAGDTLLVPLGREGVGRRGPDHSGKAGATTAGEGCDWAGGNRVISMAVSWEPLEASQKVT